MARKPGTRTRKKPSATDSKEMTTKPTNTKTIESGKEVAEELKNQEQEREGRQEVDDKNLQEEAATNQQKQPDIAVVDAVIVKQEPKEEEDEELLEYLFSYFVTLKPRKQVNKQGKTTWSVTLTPFEKKALGLIEREVKKS